MWQHGYTSGKEAFGALLIAAFIEMGRTSIRLNELRDIIEETSLELPEYYLGEYVLELLDELKVTA